LGADYATFRMIYSPASHTVDYYVNGALVISDSPGISETYPLVAFGGVDGNFRFVSLTTDGAPEPSTWAMMLAGFAGLGFAGYRKAKGVLTLS
jgi:PEP-CTERM motif